MRKDDPVAAVLDSIRRIVHLLRVGSRAAEKQIGLSGAQLFVLKMLANHPAGSLNELAARTRTHQSSVSVVVQRLADRGLVTRHHSTKDARHLQLRVTSAGQRSVRNAPDVAQDRLIQALERLVISDQIRLAGLLSRVAADMGAGGATPAMFFEEDPTPASNRSRQKTKKKKGD